MIPAYLLTQFNALDIELDPLISGDERVANRALMFKFTTLAKA